MTTNTCNAMKNRTLFSWFRKDLSRILAFILCLSILCICIPMSVMAEEEEYYEIPGTEDIAQEESAPPEGTVVIVENVIIQETTDVASNVPSTSEVLSPESGSDEPIDADSGSVAASNTTEEVNNLAALLDDDEEPEDLTYVNDFPVVVQTQVFDNSGVTHQSTQSPYVDDTGTQGGANQGSNTVSELYIPKPDAQPISNEIVIKDTTESITPPDEVQDKEFRVRIVKWI